MRSLRRTLLCALLLLALATGVPAVAAAELSPSEEVRLEADIQADGDAKWHVVVRVPLETESDVETFEAFAQGTGTGDFDVTLTAFEAAAVEASETTERDMVIVDTSRDWDVIESDNGTLAGVGEIRLSFTWTNFARVDGERLIVDDAFETTDGTWLPGLAEGQTLVLQPPEGYGVTTAPVAPRDRTLQWDGPVLFQPGYFEIVYQPGVEPSNSLVDLSNLLLVGALVLSGAALALGLYLLWRRRSEAELSMPLLGGWESDSDSDSDSDSESATTNGAAGAEAGLPDETDLELLSDEERVERLLERNGGRMKQAKIVEETDWSNAKVSQLLSSMAETDRVEKLRIGRENLISLPGEGMDDIENEP